MRRLTPGLFVLLAALHVAPLWTVRYLPLGDGPSHVYNAWVLHGLATGSAPAPIQDAFTIDWRPHPNWTGHVLLALAMTVAPPLIAEKLFLTLLLAIFYFGAWRFATATDPARDVYAFLVFPLTYTQTFMAGYYNFSLSIGLFLLLLAFWWKHQEDRSLRILVAEAALLVLLYFTHPQATVLAIGAIGLLSVSTRRWGRLVALLPATLLLAGFGRTEAVPGGLQSGINWEALRILANVETMRSLGDGQLLLSRVVSLVFAALIILTLIRWERSRVRLLFVLAFLFAAMMFWFPGSGGTRDIFHQRNSIFVFLTLLGWFTTRVPRRLVLALVVAIAMASFMINADWIRRLAPGMAATVRAHRAIEPGTTFLPLHFSFDQSPSMVNVYVHSHAYVALEKQLVDYGNYEPKTNYFPIAWRRPGIHTTNFEPDPSSVDIAAIAPIAEYVTTRAMPEHASQRSGLEALYRLVYEYGDLRIYRRKDPLASQRVVLLPLLGTIEDQGAPQGARWRVDQTVINRGDGPARLVFHHCVADMPCELSIEKDHRISSADRYSFVYVPPNANLDFRTIVGRSDIVRPDLSFAIPAVSETEFRTGSLTIGPLVSRHKLGVRVYTLHWDRVDVKLRLRDPDQILGEKTFTLPAYGMFVQADLRSEFAAISQSAGPVTLELEAAGPAQIWAFVTEGDDQGRTRVVQPR
jgi:hypothetical protein